MGLPRSCTDCIFFRYHDEQKATGFCHRHAPAPADEEFETVYWPIVPDKARCGGGEAQSEEEPANCLICADCEHWYQPNDQPITPDFRGDKSRDWWANSGYCTRFAPSPSNEAEKHIYWKVTNAIDGCGDGNKVLQQEENE